MPKFLATSGFYWAYDTWLAMSVVVILIFMPKFLATSGFYWAYDTWLDVCCP